MIFSLPAPLYRSQFRHLWLAMGVSYAGDRFQQLAQGWFVATATNSALAVGLIGTLGTIPLLLLPLCGVLADQLDRRHLLVAVQAFGAVVVAVLALLLLTHRLAVWHVYVFAILEGCIWLLARPSYKVILTEVVPAAEIHSAVAINSTTETAAMATVNGAGGLLLALAGLPLAFIVNAASYGAAALTVWCTPGPRRAPSRGGPRRLLPDLAAGLAYLAGDLRLLYPLLLTTATVLAAAPLVTVLPAIVHARGGSIVSLGLLGTGGALGSMAGAMWAGRGENERSPLRRYGLLGLVTAAAIAQFVLTPLGVLSAISLAAIGFVLFGESVWNTSRVRRLAPDTHQARLQAWTSLAFSLGYLLATLWGGVAVDRFGISALWGGVGLLAACSLGTLVLSTPEGSAALKRAS